MNDDYLQSLKPGDKVFVRSYGDLNPLLEAVERITDHFVIVRGEKCAKKNGKRAGSSGWHAVFLHEATPQAIEEHNVKQMRRSLSRMSWDNVPEDTVRAVYKMTRARAIPATTD